MMGQPSGWGQILFRGQAPLAPALTFQWDQDEHRTMSLRCTMSLSPQWRMQYAVLLVFVNLWRKSVTWLA